jgi:hypothetical protein
MAEVGWRGEGVGDGRRLPIGVRNAHREGGERFWLFGGEREGMCNRRSSCNLLQFKSTHGGGRFIITI